MSSLIRKEGSQFVNWIPPFLEIMKEKGGSATPKEIREGIIERLQVPEDFLSERLKSGQLRFDNQVYWAKQYLAYEELVTTSSHGVWALTEKGTKVSLTYEDAKEIVRKWVKFFANVRKSKQTGDSINNIDDPLDTTEDFDDDEIEVGENLNLLQLIKGTTPRGFEHLCARLLREYDFESIEVTKQSGDGGFDGIATLKLNPFVNMSVYFECKKYDGTVPVAKVREFIGVLASDKNGVDKGIFITTGSFTSEAYRLEKNNSRLELIDGEKLVSMFEQKILGVTHKIIYEPDPVFFSKYMADAEQNSV